MIVAIRVSSTRPAVGAGSQALVPRIRDARRRLLRLARGVAGTVVGSLSLDGGTWGMAVPASANERLRHTHVYRGDDEPPPPISQMPVRLRHARAVCAPVFIRQLSTQTNRWTRDQLRTSHDRHASIRLQFSRGGAVAERGDLLSPRAAAAT